MPALPRGGRQLSLPSSLLQELGIDAPQQGLVKGKNRQPTRKERRKAERQQKAPHRNECRNDRAQYSKAPRPPAKGRARPASTAAATATGRKNARLEIPKKKDKGPETEEDLTDLEDLDVRSGEEEEEDEEEDEDEDGDEEVDGESPDGDVKVKQPAMSRSVREKIAQDDAEIAELERKLGLRGRKNLPKSFEEDGLGDLLADLDGSDGAAPESKKRKAEADEWLAQKRRKATREAARKEVNEGAGEDDDDDDDDDDDNDEDDEDDEEEGEEEVDEEMLDGADMVGLDGLSSEDDGDLSGEEDDSGSGLEKGSDGGDMSAAAASDEDFSGFGSGEDEPKKDQPRVRENPYVAPTTGVNVAKYVPPSRRQDTGSDAQLTQRLRRQLQGLVNRITESNMISIVGDIEKIYREQPRQYVTSILADLILIQVCDPTSLPDTLLILSAGFATAVFKVIGMDFGALLVQEAVGRFDQYYKQAVSTSGDASKETSNLITFLTELYNFQLVGCNLVFDYIRLLLGKLTELNAELLLRIIRLSGTLLRQDDPSSLKDIVTLIRPAVAATGENTMSVRTKFMIETINDLKNNKMKAGASASAVISEHTIRMKKLLGSLNARKLKSTEPLRIGLKDIEDSDKKGKWWLVGASWAGRPGDEKAATAAARKAPAKDAGEDSESDALLDGEQGGMPDLAELAREQMMNTDVRRSIFISILSATDYEDAYVRLLKLRLNRERQREMANVILQCAGAEQQYNPYYTLVARRLCSDRKVRWSFQDSLWKLFRRLGESIFGDEAEEVVDQDEAVETRRLVNIAKMYGALISEGALGLDVLKCLNLPYLQAKARSFVEVLLITALLESSKDGRESAEATIGKMMARLGDAPELTRGLRWFLKKVVRKSDLAGSKADTKKLRGACKTAEDALEAVQVAGMVAAE